MFFCLAYGYVFESYEKETRLRNKIKLKMVNLSFHIENPSFTCVQYITMKRRKKGKTLIELQTQTWNISSPDAINN